MSDTGCSPCQLHAAWIDAEKVGNVDRQLVGEVDELVVRLAVASIGILINGLAFYYAAAIRVVMYVFAFSSSMSNDCWFRQFQGVIFTSCPFQVLPISVFQQQAGMQAHGFGMDHCKAQRDEPKGPFLHCRIKKLLA